MRSKLEKATTVPLKYRRYKPSEWPGGWGEFVTEREKWNASQPPVLLYGKHHDGRQYAYAAGPLGDLTDLIKARREARAADWAAAAYTGQQQLTEADPERAEPEPVESP